MFSYYWVFKSSLYIPNTSSLYIPNTSSLYSPNISPKYKSVLYKYFFSICVLSFHSLKSVFWREVSTFDESPNHFFFNGWCFWWNLKQTQDNKENSSQGSGPSLTSTSYKWQAKKNSPHIRLSKFKKKKKKETSTESIQSYYQKIREKKEQEKQTARE